MFFLNLDLDAESPRYCFSSDESGQSETIQFTAAYHHRSDVFESETGGLVSSLDVIFRTGHRNSEGNMLRGLAFNHDDPRLIFDVSVTESAFANLKRAAENMTKIRASFSDSIEFPGQEKSPQQAAIKPKDDHSGKVVWDTTKGFALALASFSFGFEHTENPIETIRHVEPERTNQPPPVPPIFGKLATISANSSLTALCALISTIALCKIAW